MWSVADVCLVGELVTLGLLIVSSFLSMVD